MRVEIRPPCPLHLFGEESIKYRLSSVGVWVVVKKRGVPNKYLAVRQADQPDKPWGIPAGKISDSDLEFQDVAIRELREETGLVVNRKELIYLNYAWNKSEDKDHLLYWTTVDISTFDLGNSTQKLDGTIIFPPPRGVDRREISQLALIPLSLAFEENILNRNPYHFKENYRGLIALRSMGLMEGRFYFERDPYLFDD